MQESSADIKETMTHNAGFLTSQIGREYLMPFDNIVVFLFDTSI